MNEMDNDSSSAIGVKEISLPLRDDLVYTAVKFLQNPRVSSRPKSEKEVFLQKKGLTHAEIQAAFEAAGISTSQDAAGHYSAMKLAQVQGYMKPSPKSKWVIVRDILNAVVLFAGAAYSLRYLYRRFIAPLLFRKKEKSLGEKVDEMNRNLTILVTDLSTAIQNLSETVSALRARQTEKSEMKELKSEVASLKALLLGRRQFPAPPVIVSSPSIPAWQLAATSTSGSGEKLDSRTNQGSRKMNHGDGISLSSSPEIIQVDDSLANQLPNVDPNSLARDPSESSESNSAEMVDMGASNSGASNSGGSGEEDTD